MPTFAVQTGTKSHLANPGQSATLYIRGVGATFDLFTYRANVGANPLKWWVGNTRCNNRALEPL